MRAVLGIENSVDADFDRWPVPGTGIWIASSVDRAAYGCPPGEPLDLWAFRAVNAALSDLACAGVSEPSVQIDLQVPIDIDVVAVDAVATGVRRSIEMSGAVLQDGCNTTFGPLALTTVVRGTGTGDVNPPGRAGASPGDLVAVSRRTGRFNAALEFLNGGPGDDVPEWLAGALLGGMPELELGKLLVGGSLMSACIDANDCLLIVLDDIARASGIGVAIDGSALERLHEGLPEEIAVEQVLNPPSGDLSLVFTFRPDLLDAVSDAFRVLARRPHVIGRCTEEAGRLRIDGETLGEAGTEILNRFWRPSSVFRYPAKSIGLPGSTYPDPG